MLDKVECPIRLLEVEAETNETQAKRFAALASGFTVLEVELTVMRDRQTSILRQGEAAVIKPGVWHDWWNASNGDARVQVEIVPGERFVHMIATFYGLARPGHTNRKAMPHPLQLDPSVQEFGDVVVFTRRRGYCSVRCLPHWRQSPDGMAIARLTPNSRASCSRRGQRSKRPVREIRAVGLIE